MNKIFNSNMSIQEYQVFELLKNDITKSDYEIKNLQSENKISLKFIFDFYAEKGIKKLNYDGPVLIEVKSRIHYPTLKRFISFSSDLSKMNIKKVLIIYGVTDVDLTDYKNDSLLVFMSIDELRKRCKSKKQDKIFTQQKLLDDFENEKKWEENNQALLIQAKSDFNKGKVTLFLGAGVSMSAKVPSWDELLKKLLSNIDIETGLSNIINEMNTKIKQECGDSYLVMGRYLRVALMLKKGDISFSNMIHDSLYSNDNESELINALTELIDPNNPNKVKSIITYNFDDLLEISFDKNNIKYASIYKGANILDSDTIPIYHVHGIIPKDKDKPSVVPVFSEEEYHRLYSDVYHWSNVDQLHALSRNRCFFIGLSMNDPNLRRLLDFAVTNKEDKPFHYAFLQRKDALNFCIEDFDKICSHIKFTKSLIDEKKQDMFYRLNYTVITEIFRELGVNIIWFQNFNELPKLIRELKNK